MEEPNHILVTGSTGTVGKHILKYLNAERGRVIVHSFKGDIRSRSDVELSLREAGKISIVVNLAAIVPIDIVNAHPGRAYSVNVGGPTNLLEVIAESGQRPYVFQCSTAHVYASSDSPISEGDRLDPISIYGRTKLYAEYAMADICNVYGMPLGIGRLFSIHDKLQVGSFLRPNIERRLEEEDLSQPFVLPGADSLRDFLLAEEAANMIAQLAFARYEGTINIASGRPTRIREFVQNLSPRVLDIRHVGKQDNLVANTAKLNEFLTLQSKRDTL